MNFECGATNCNPIGPFYLVAPTDGQVFSLWDLLKLFVVQPYRNGLCPFDCYL